MKKRFVLFVTAAVFSLFGSVAAADYTVDAFEIDHFIDTAPSWYCSISVPEIRGMADAEEQKTLNETFVTEAANIQKAYEESIEEAKADFPDADASEMPHFGFEYNFERLVNTEKLFVLATNFYQAAGSSMTNSNYYTFDKETGKLMDFDSLFSTDDFEAVLTDYLIGEMEAANQMGSTFWTDCVAESVQQIADSRSWYLDQNGQPVITFEKYEVAPGAMGQSSFTIPNEVMDSIR